MSKLWTIGSGLLVLGMGFLIAAVVGNLVAIGCLLWWPWMVQVVLKCTICALTFANVLSVAALVLAKISETKGEWDMEKEFISEQEAVALLRYGRVYMPDGAFRYAVGPYPVAGTDMWVVGEYEQQLLCVTSAVALRLLRGSRVCLLFH